jgi:Protein of unknown function (DUF3987)
METQTVPSMTSLPFTSDIGDKTEGLAPDADERLTIPQSVYEELPGVLSKVCEYFPEGYERDVFFTGAIVVCSGVLSRVKFPHRDKKYHLNLYALITAGTGSGKGDAVLAEKLCAQIEKRLQEEWQTDMAEWKAKRKEVEAIKVKNRIHAQKKEPLEDAPELGPQPQLRTISIAANSSARGFIDRLAINKGEGVLFETETKTLLITRKQDWGETEAYLKGFHNEPFKLDRKGGECIRIPVPHFAAIFTGTPQATIQFIPSAEDGLFSRFMHYRYEPPTTWRSQRPTRRHEARDVALNHAGRTMDELRQYLAGRREFLFVRLSEKQWDMIDDEFRGATEALDANGSDKFLLANVRRSALIAARISCILAVLRHFENDLLAEQDEITVEDREVQSAITLARTYLAHAIELAGTLKVPAQSNLTGHELSIFMVIPEEPASITSEEIAIKTGSSLRKVQRTLKTLMPKGCLIPGKKGVYSRVKRADLSNAASIASQDATETTQTTQTTVATMRQPDRISKSEHIHLTRILQ